MKQIIALLLISMLLIVACDSQTAKNNNDVDDAPDDNSDDNGEVEAQDEEDEAEVDEQKSSKFKTISAAMSAGIPYKCTYSDDGVTSEMIVKGQKFKSETKMKEGTTYTISDSKKMYIWSDMQEDGIVYDLDEMKKIGDAQTYPGAQKQQTTDIDKEYDMDCSVTIATDSMFVPPSNVNFQDMSQILKNMQETFVNLPDMENVQYN